MLADQLAEHERMIATGTVGAKGQRDPRRALCGLLETYRADAECEIEMKVSQDDPYSRAVFVELCIRYGLKAYRRPRQRETTMLVKAPEPFLTNVLWPMYERCVKSVNIELSRHFSETTSAFFGDASEGGGDG